MAAITSKTNATRLRRYVAKASVVCAIVAVPMGISALASAEPQPGQQQEQIQPGPGQQNPGTDQPGQDNRGPDQQGGDRRGRHGYVVPEGYNDNPSAPGWPGGGEPPTWWWQVLRAFGLA
ncbi:hypothetical protein [Nocardia sp. NPDC052112]|uniref:hypothetical protein n=1 Tax=Nocardia sp. NPDC052112 TaxID=3155646 RepID=UPI0034432072